MNNKKMEWIESVIGGVFGIIAIIAAIIEYSMGEDGALAGCIKDISGTMIVVVLLIAFIRSMPKKPKNVDELLKNAVGKWGDGNAPLIFEAEGYEAAKNTTYEQGFVLLQDPKKFVSLSNEQLTKGSNEWSKYAKYGKGNGYTGKFLNMPSYKRMTEDDFDVLFVMGQSHFKQMPEIDQIIKDIISAININCKGDFGASRIGSSLEFKVNCPKIHSKEDIEQFVNMIDFVISLVKVVS